MQKRSGKLLFSTAAVVYLSAIALTAVSAGFCQSVIARGPDKRSDWQSDYQNAMQAKQEGDFPQSEKYFLSSLRKVKVELRSAPASSFASRYFPIRDALRKLYLDTAAAQEDSQSEGKTIALYRKAVALPGAPQQAWLQYADYLRRKGKDKEADNVEDEGKKKSLYWQRQ